VCTYIPARLASILRWSVCTNLRGPFHSKVQHRRGGNLQTTAASTTPNRNAGDLLGIGLPILGTSRCHFRWKPKIIFWWLAPEMTLSVTFKIRCGPKLAQKDPRKHQCWVGFEQKATQKVSQILQQNKVGQKCTKKCRNPKNEKRS